VTGVSGSTTVIRPSHGWVRIDLRELWAYRELLQIFVWRDLKVRYKQTVIGGAWAVIQPFFTMVVFSVFFGGLAKIPSDGVPYPIFAYTALVPWMFFSNALTAATTAVMAQGNIITKVYFPRLILPAAAVGAGLVDFVIAFVVLLGMMVFFRVSPGPAILALPLFLALVVATALGVGLWLAALNAMYRDVRYALPFLVQVWLFASPVAYPSSLVPEPWRVVYGLNPMVGVIEGFRWSLLGAGDPPGPMVAASTLAVGVMLVGGLFYFRRIERTFADLV